MQFNPEETAPRDGTVVRLFWWTGAQWIMDHGCWFPQGRWNRYFSGACVIYWLPLSEPWYSDWPFPPTTEQVDAAIERQRAGEDLAGKVRESGAVVFHERPAVYSPVGPALQPVKYPFIVIPGHINEMTEDDILKSFER